MALASAYTTDGASTARIVAARKFASTSGFAVGARIVVVRISANTGGDAATGTARTVRQANLRARGRCSRCKPCGGKGICEHGRNRSICMECGGKDICEHRKCRARCKECRASPAPPSTVPPPPPPLAAAPAAPPEELACPFEDMNTIAERTACEKCVRSCIGLDILTCPGPGICMM